MPGAGCSSEGSSIRPNTTQDVFHDLKKFDNEAPLQRRAWYNLRHS